MKEKMKRILERSVKVLKECSLRNGAIVASNPKDPDYPKGMKNYFFVWPRDASFACVACDMIGLKKIPERFFGWCWNAEEFKERGIFHMRYHLDGKMYGRQFQPDQTGSLLWAIEHHSKSHNVEKFSDLIEKAADGICSSWNGKCFKRYYDVWEERVTSPKRYENFTYSLAACVKGLESASKLKGPKAMWEKCKNQMNAEIEKSYDKKLGYFVRKVDDDKDTAIDSSLMGLLWPNETIEASDPRIKQTIEKIIESNSLEKFGISRYKGDKYAGYLRRKEAGAWPVLNFWLSICLEKMGYRTRALKYFDWVVKRVDEKLPEQIKDGKPSSITPLVWSHSMFIISGKLLKLL